MRIVLAPDSFKGCLSAPEVCAALETGMRRADPSIEIESIPIADGGEGTTEVLVAATHGRLEHAQVTGPRGATVEAPFGLLGDGDAAVLEMAAASGLALLADAERDPLLATTYGTGELILAALDQGARDFVIGIGGSATNEAGMGMAAALGVCFYDAAGKPLEEFGGAALERLAHLDLAPRDPRVAASRFRVACDVTNPLYGPSGAAHVYAPQKGADAATVARLDRGLENFARVVQQDLGLDLATMPGAGAAGGLGAGLVAFCGATLEPGAQLLLDAVDFRARVRSADLVLTGEGRIDRQTAFGKGPGVVAAVSSELGIPVVGVAGTLEADIEELPLIHMTAAFAALSAPVSLAVALDPSHARHELERLGFNLVQTLSLGQRLN
jgi:glycerate kinase